jgi:hypothetical protein
MYDSIEKTTRQIIEAARGKPIVRADYTHDGQPLRNEWLVCSCGSSRRTLLCPTCKSRMPAKVVPMACIN